MPRVANVGEKSAVVSLASLQNAIVLAYKRGVDHGMDIMVDRGTDVSDDGYITKVADEVIKIIIDGLQ